MFALKHLVGKIDHLVVHLYPHCFTQVCEVVEEVGVLPVEEDWYDVALVGDGFLNE